MKQSSHYTAILSVFLLLSSLQAADGVFVRFKLEQPGETHYHIVLAGYIHRDPWYLPRAAIPTGADKDPSKRVAIGEWTPWFDLKTHAGNKLHGKMTRAGGLAEFPNVTVETVTTNKTAERTVSIEIATAEDEKKVVKRWKETFAGALTSFLVSPDPAKDADSLETAAEMTARRLSWAKEASKGKVVSPKQLIVQTNFWAPQRLDLNLKEAEVLRLLGFNTVGNQMSEVKALDWFRVPGHTHNVRHDLAVTRDEIDKVMEKHAGGQKAKLAVGVPFNFSDEITAGTIGENKTALANFHAWLAKRGVNPRDLGVTELTEVVPIETPDVLKQRQKDNEKTAARIFYYTSRFRQEATTERFRWNTEAFHKHFGEGPVTSTLTADHPYFSGTGLGMGMGPNPAWGRAALAADWFDLARVRAVDLIGIEDWMGLQYMYGPNYTWEGFQLMGFQAAMMRSGGRGEQPIIAWITPSDETNLRLKSASALCQGAKHFFYWTYGPTATSTENYWSDLRGAYDGVVAITRQLAEAEAIIAPGKTRKTRVAMLYSISSDLWQPFGYVHMLERRGLYLALIHRQYLVDFLTEEDIDSGRLKDYDILYTCDPCIKTSAAKSISDWAKTGGCLYGTTAAGTRNEFNEEVSGLSEVFGATVAGEIKVQKAQYHIRGAMNTLPYLDQIDLSKGSGSPTIGALGVKIPLKVTQGTVVGTFKDGSPAVIRNDFGKGKGVVVASCPGIAYIKEAKFVPRELKEKWTETERSAITSLVQEVGVHRLVELSEPVVEAGIFESDAGTSLILANFTYRPLEQLQVRIHLPKPVVSVATSAGKSLKFTCEPAPKGKHPPGYPHVATFVLPLGINEIVVLK